RPAPHPRSTLFPYTTLFRSLRRALAATPDNDAVRLLLAETLIAEDLPAEALVEFDRLHAAGSLAPEHMLTAGRVALAAGRQDRADRKSTRLNSSHSQISYAV